MNRTIKRRIIRNLKYRKSLNKRTTKGAFGSLPLYLQEVRKRIWAKKAEKYAKILLTKPQDIVESTQKTEESPNI